MQVARHELGFLVSDFGIKVRHRRRKTVEVVVVDEDGTALKGTSNFSTNSNPLEDDGPHPDIIGLRMRD